MTETGKHGPPHGGEVRNDMEAAPDCHASRNEGRAHLALERALSAELTRLEDEFGGALAEEVVVEEFTACVRSFESARIRLYVPVLSYRNARQALRAKVLTLDVGRDEDITGPGRSRPEGPRISITRERRQPRG